MKKQYGSRVVVKTSECTVTVTSKGNTVHVKKKMNPHYKPNTTKPQEAIRIPCVFPA